MLWSVFLFYWENTYALRQELQRWKSNFLEKYGQDTLFQFSHQNWDLAQIKQALYAGGLFVSKKMVILEGVPKDSADDNALSTDKIEKFFEDFQQNAQFLSPDTVVILVSNKPDKRTKPFKRFSENVQLKVFDPYKEAQLKAFIVEHLQPLQIDEESVSYFLLKVGNDLYRLAHETEKLKFWLPKRTVQIAKEHIDHFCFGLVEGDAFVIFDQLFSDPRLAVQSLAKMESDGKSRNEVQGLLTWGLKIYLTLLDFHQQGITSGKEIIAQTKLHPFVVNKNLKLLLQILEHQNFIIHLFKKLIDLEYAIKTWKYPDGYYRLAVKQELLSLHTPSLIS